VTGGEPLLRPQATSLIRRLSRIEGIEDLSLTTNGKLLPAFAAELKASGVGRINISLDSLRHDRFFAMTRRDALRDVLEGIQAAADAGFSPIKINAVVIRGVNDDEIESFATFSRETGHTVRFIEFMPLDSGHQWTMEQVVPGREIFDRLKAAFPLVQLPRPERVGNGSEVGFRGCRWRDRNHRPGHRSILRKLQPNPSDGGREAANLPLLGLRARSEGTRSGVERTTRR
jgi:molybdenum cofactor biosynthesis enzyme MoaA